MLELSVNRVGGPTIGIVRIDETDPEATPEVLQPLDEATLTVVMATLARFQEQADATRAAWA